MIYFILVFIFIVHLYADDCSIQIDFPQSQKTILNEAHKNEARKILSQKGFKSFDKKLKNNTATYKLEIEAMSDISLGPDLVKNELGQIASTYSVLLTGHDMDYAKEGEVSGRKDSSNTAILHIYTALRELPDCHSL